MAALLYALAAGALFGFGLVISGMANPDKVRNFLDVTGHWDPSLALVMGGALAITIPAFRHFKRRSHCATGAPLQIPQNRLIDRPLVFGAVLFGLGWGLIGLCPGPALVGIVTLESESLLFVGAMLAGVLLFQLTAARKT